MSTANYRIAINPVPLQYLKKVVLDLEYDVYLVEHYSTCCN